MRRLLGLLFSGVFAVTLLSSASLLTASPASAAPLPGVPTTYCADPDTDPSMDTGAGTMITCETSVTNTITGINPTTGVPSGSAVVRVTECRGPASGRLDPSFLACSTNQQNLVGLVTYVEQCDYVGYGGGNVLRCNVNVTNEFVGVTPQALSSATVNQCNGSAPVTTGCNPFPASTTNATITQCNGSSYGGGQEDFNCLASGTTTATLNVTVNQCNNSNYGGGSWLNCSASVTNSVSAAPPTPTPTPTPTPSPSPSPSGAPGASPSGAPTSAPSGAPSSVPGATTLTPAAVPPATGAATGPGQVPAVVSGPSTTPVPSNATVVDRPIPTLPDTSTLGVPAARSTPAGQIVIVGLTLIALATFIVVSQRRGLKNGPGVR